MKEPKYTKILVSSNHKDAFSVVVSLLKSGHEVILFTDDENNAQHIIDQHFEDILTFTQKEFNHHLQIVNEFPLKSAFDLAVVYTNEDKSEKVAAIDLIQSKYNSLKIIVNSESISLIELQEGSKSPNNIIIGNWSNPAHTTYFLELVTNNETNYSWVSELDSYARAYWEKNPYVIYDELGIRSQIMTAMIREAFYLVENGYASIEDIDRACRNDPGYYLPFSGNFRYMDLMGTFAYGMVMKDLNPELAAETVLPRFFKDILEKIKAEGKQVGMYTLTKKQAEEQEQRSRRFSYEIKAIIEKYPAL